MGKRVVRDLHHEREDGEEHDRVEQRPHRAEDRGRVLDLQLLAHKVQEDLSPLVDLPDAPDHPELGGLGGADDGLGAFAHRP